MHIPIWILKFNVNDYRCFSNTPEGQQTWLSWLDKAQAHRLFAAEWPLVTMTLFEGEIGEKRKEAKKPIPDFSKGYVFHACSERAKKIVESIAPGEVDYLPINTSVGQYYDMNIHEIDCLDEDKSEIKRFKSSGRIMDVEKYALFWERLEGQHIFIIKKVGFTPIFVTDDFKELLESSNFPELYFLPVPLAGE